MSGPVTRPATKFQARCAAATCRSCGNPGLEPVLDLGDMPLSDGFVKPEEVEQERGLVRERKCRIDRDGRTQGEVLTPRGQRLDDSPVDSPVQTAELRVRGPRRRCEQRGCEHEGE